MGFIRGNGIGIYLVLCGGVLCGRAVCLFTTRRQGSRSLKFEKGGMFP